MDDDDHPGRDRGAFDGRDAMGSETAVAFKDRAAYRRETLHDVGAECDPTDGASGRSEGSQ